MGGSTKLMSSGAGGVILTTPGSIAADVTVNLPTQNSTLAINGPAFSVFRNANQTVSASTTTKIAFNGEHWDTANCFDNITNYRFTPNVAGYYYITGCLMTGGGTVNFCTLYRNGSPYLMGSRTDVSTGYMSNVADLVYFNGSTDYVELYGYSTSTTFSGNASGTDQICKFSGCLVRAA